LRDEYIQRTGFIILAGGHCQNRVPYVITKTCFLLEYQGVSAFGLRRVGEGEGDEHKVERFTSHDRLPRCWGNSIHSRSEPEQNWIQGPAVWLFWSESYLGRFQKRSHHQLEASVVFGRQQEQLLETFGLVCSLQFAWNYPDGSAVIL